MDIRRGKASEGKVLTGSFGIAGGCLVDTYGPECDVTLTVPEFGMTNDPIDEIEEQERIALGRGGNGYFRHTVVITIDECLEFMILAIPERVGVVEAIDERLHPVEEGKVHDHVATVEMIGEKKYLHDIGVPVNVLPTAAGGAVTHDVGTLELELFSDKHFERELRFDSGIINTGLGEGFGTEEAAVAGTAWFVATPVTSPGKTIVNPKADAQADFVGLGHVHERSMNGNVTFFLGTQYRTEIDGGLHGTDEFLTTINIT